MNITIVGGGNIGTQFAVHCAEKRHKVTIYTSKPKRFDRHLFIVDAKGHVSHEGDIAEATNSAEKAFANADIIFVTVPAFCMRDMADKIYPYASKNVKIGLIPGTGGGECSFGACREKGAVLFGMQRVPSVARIVEYGKSVCAAGYRETLHIAALPCQETENVSKIISDIFDMPCASLPNYLSLTMTPSNPILHTTRLKVIFSNYKEGMLYESIPLFYEEWDDESSKLLFQCDDEVQCICQSLREFDLSYVKSLKVHYDSETPEQLTKKISSIQSFKGLKTPAVEVNGKYMPDLYSRYFTADFPYGLAILVQIAYFADVDVPNMQETLEWYDKIALVKDKFCFADYGIKSKKDFYSFYQ